MNEATHNEDLGIFIIRPARESTLVPDEAFAQIGEWNIHIERMDVDAIWMGVTNEQGEGVRFDFFIGEDKVDNGEGEMVHPLFLRAEDK